MKTGFKRALAIASLALAGQVWAQVTIYEWDNFQGRSFNADKQLADLDNSGFNQRAASMVVQGNRWEACEEARFGGRCMVLRPGAYTSLNAMGLSGRMASLREIPANARVYDNQYAAAPVPSQVVMFEQVGFAGRSLAVVEALDDLRRSGFNDSANL
jgi:Beta/Gamma crystallin